MIIGDLIKKYRKEHHYSLQDFADRSGLSKQYVWILENNLSPQTGKPPKPNMMTLNKIAKGMNMSFDDLTARINQSPEIEAGNPVSAMYNALARVPLYADLCCGKGMFVEDNIVDYLAVPDQWLVAGKQYFGQRAHGDSMRDARIEEGDILIFERSSVIEPGKIGCFCVDENMAVCKRYMVSGAKVYLMSANEKYPPIEIDQYNSSFHVVGVLASVVQDRRG